MTKSRHSGLSPATLPSAQTAFENTKTNSNLVVARTKNLQALQQTLVE